MLQERWLERRRAGRQGGGGARPLPRRLRRRLLAGLAVVAWAAVAVPAAAERTVIGGLPRAAHLGFQAEETADGGLEVRSLEAGSPAALAGLREGDRLVAVDGVLFAKNYLGLDLLGRLDGGVPVELGFVRAGGRPQVARFTPAPRPPEAIAGVETQLGVVVTPDGARLRTLQTRPRGATGPLPAIFVTQWVSCGSIEVRAGDPTREVMQALAERSGMALLRVERSTSGDSEGPGCHQLDFETEVAHYRFALGELLRSPWVDPRRVVVLGLSLGSVTAPLVAAGHPIAGMIVSGGGAHTYFERMLAFDRLAMERLGEPQELQAQLLPHAEFHLAYLLGGEDPERVVAQRPHLAGVWQRMRGTGDGVHYGRPFAWHQQAARRDFLAAWAELAAPVLVLYAEHDQFEPPAGHRLIAETVNRRRPGAATYVELPAMGHDWAVYPSAEAAMRWERGVNAPELVVEPILAWLAGWRRQLQEPGDRGASD